ncbi:3-deoxy-D-manno-octulosonic acid transferase [Flavihumibacter rivuli]|uniref:3-deoxy-D-manno-octulosonic acid transferase n=1 Tax=Flavihumibacter rivuli TaxID=2838156 RepID=UPI001BDDF34C|nr:glycosyltransferase N-terminal domain-containing protein [Flavihumibacter rivuli]ULQ58177.1 3-deoxy-D-manno-octulosonic acid transferase [Flavihumibacter rivuli]
MSLLLYNIFLILYRALLGLIAPWNSKARRWIIGRKDLFSSLVKAFRENQEPVIWMHLASLGEFEQGRPLLEKIKVAHPECRILLTFFSPSGYEAARGYNGADYIFYLPMDSPQSARKFLDIVQPKMVIWVKYEFWYYFLTQMQKRKIPVILVSGIFRDSQPFFKWYGNLHRHMLHCFHHLFVQNDTSVDLLATAGITQVTLAGDTRYDRVIEIAEKFLPIAPIERFIGSSRVIVAGSTWPEDEEELDHYANTHPGLKFIIAPHELSDAHLKEIEQLFRHTIRYSQWLDLPEEEKLKLNGKNVLIIDNIGMLSRLYHYATIAFVGGGFGEDGIHNILEAAVYGKPVVFGPVYDKYAEAIGLVEKGGAFPVGNALELERKIDQLLTDPAFYEEASGIAREFVWKNQGASKIILDHIEANRLLTN